MEQIDPEIEDRIFKAHKQISAAKMRELSPGELRLLYKKELLRKLAPLAAGMPQDQIGALPGGLPQ